MIKTLRKLKPVAQYFAKNGGLNTITSAAAVGFLPTVIEILNNPAVDMGVEQLVAANPSGAAIATGVIVLRSLLGAYRVVRK